MRVALGSDERTALTDRVADDLRSRGHDLVLVGPPGGDDKQWTAVGHEVGALVAGGECDTAVLFCWTGTCGPVH
jgi:ribose 5-phosphate isomerase B